jgi:hypothetical protein
MSKSGASTGREDIGPSDGNARGQRVEDLRVDQVRSVEITVLPEAFDQSGREVASGQRREDGRAVDDQHGGSVTVAAGPNGGDDSIRSARRRSDTASAKSESYSTGIPWRIVFSVTTRGSTNWSR